MEQTIIGIIEKIKINGREALAKVDTGATRNSMDLNLAAELRLGPIVRTSKISTSHGKGVRPVVEAEVEIAGRKLKSHFNLSHRKHMKYKVLIGQETLKQGFLIDPSKKNETSNN